MNYLLSSIFAIIISILVFYTLYYNNGASSQLYNLVNPFPPCPIVETMDGAVQGVTSYSRDGTLFYEFLGIPYAAAPVGEFRFESPQRAKSWAPQVLKADKYGNECPQVHFLEKSPLGSEDCLFVNVFSPKVPSSKKASVGNKRQSLLPVMIFIHGGGLMFGSGDIYRPDYFMDEDVVLVTFNYRLGPLGFLSTGTGDGGVRGNMGFKDQTFLLKWVQANIEGFGGNPARVTLFGESAGGASVHLQLLSPMARGLFHKAIAQSGEALSPWNIKHSPGNQSKWFASQLGCSTGNTREMVVCLKRVPLGTMMEFQEKTAKDPGRELNSFFGLTIESTDDHDTFIREDPLAMMLAGEGSKIPLMMGYTSHEGLFLSAGLAKSESVLQVFIENFVQLAPNSMFYQVGTKSPLVLEADMAEIKEFYFGAKARTAGSGGQMTHKDQFQALTNLYSDWLWALSFQRTASLMAKYSPKLYAYYYSYEGSFQYAETILAYEGILSADTEYQIYKLGKAIKRFVFEEESAHLGAGHADELALLFKLTGLSDIRRGDLDYQMSKDMVKLWVSFGSEDNDVLKFGEQIWSPLDKSGRNLKLFNINNSSGSGSQSGMISIPHEDRLEFLKIFRPDIFTN